MKTILTFFIFFVLGEVLYGQKKLKDYDEICYCVGNTPHSILSYDNNWDLLLTFKDGLSKKGLDSLQITYTKSQLKLLSVFKLTRFENGKYFTNFPIFDTSQTRYLRKKTLEIASLIIPLIESDIKSLVVQLGNINYSENQFSILFSYVLDGLTWQKFEEKSLINPLILTTDNYPWSGTFWLLTPQHKTFYGTNVASDSSFSIGITRSQNEPGLEIYNDEDELLGILLKNYIHSGKVTDEKVLATFGRYNLFDKKGNLTIPIIVEEKSNKLYYYCSQIAHKICTKLVLNDSFDEVQKVLNLKNREQTVIILYHEVMWDLLSIIEERHFIEKPDILKNPNHAELTDVSKLVYITRKK